MKIKKEKTAENKLISLRLPNKMLANMDSIAKQNKLSRQKLIIAILSQVLANDGFVLKI